MSPPTLLLRRLLTVAACALLATSALADDADLAARAHALLTERCVSCHGPARTKAGLRLDLRTTALAGSRHGRDVVLVPGDAAASVLLARVAHVDPAERMPPDGEALTPEELETLRAWIEAGAAWPEGAAEALADGAEADAAWTHWAWVAPSPADDAPPGAEAGHPVDRGASLWDEQAARLLPDGRVVGSPRADLVTLARRVSLDLTGLPPTPERVDALRARAAARSEDVAYLELVDELLASPRYGERWASMWLDLARYADTRGYESDGHRTIWRYRDWVVDAFNANQPFDAFTIEQLAGDLLSEPTTEQLLATAFHRNTMTNDEGGTDDEEFRVAAVVDRVDTTFEVWTATTVACARCHDHKFDPIDAREYFGLYAFFDQTEDADRPDDAPVLATPTPTQAARIDELSEQLARVEQRLLADDERLAPFEAAWIERLEQEHARAARRGLRFRPWYRAGPFKPETLERGVESAFETDFGPETALDTTELDADGRRLWQRREDYADGVVHTDFSGRGVAFYLYREFDVAQDGPLQLRFGSDDALKVWLDGELVHENFVYRGAALDQDRITVELTAGHHELLLKLVNGGGPAGFAFRAVPLDLPAEVLAALEVPGSERDDDQRAALHRAFREFAPQLAPLRAERDALRADLAAIEPPLTPILRELPEDARRTTRVHVGGDFLSPGEVVTPDVPAIFPPLPEDAPRDRLGLARWLVDGRHPLTARVFVNRVWAELFGAGLVTTPEDFGTQGEPPVNGRVLDDLALSFVTSGWDIKALLRTIVTSERYRRASVARTGERAADPDNRHLLRGPRFRLPAETVRDQALFVSGLLVERRGGPPVMPPQPEGLWQVVYNTSGWEDATDEDRWRRGLYTYWRRTAPYPSMTTFDAPSRELCVSRRIRTNTPLQALVTLNDPVFVEAAQGLARRMLREAGSAAADRARRGFRLCLLREPDAAELEPLVALHDRSLAHYAARPEDAAALAGFVDGASLLGPLPDGASTEELAAWTVVANVLLNLDEFLVKG